MIYYVSQSPFLEQLVFPRVIARKLKLSKQTRYFNIYIAKRQLYNGPVSCGLENNQFQPCVKKAETCCKAVRHTITGLILQEELRQIGPYGKNL